MAHMLVDGAEAFLPTTSNCWAPTPHVRPTKRAHIYLLHTFEQAWGSLVYTRMDAKAREP